MKPWPGTHGPETQEVMNKLFPPAKKPTLKQLDKARAKVSRLWNLMCAEEGVEAHSDFVVFDPTNKYSAEYNKAVNVFFTLRRAVR